MAQTCSEIVAAELRAIAARRNISQSTIAGRLGVTQMWVSRRMSGAVALTVDNLVALARALECEPVDVLVEALALLDAQPAVV